MDTDQKKKILTKIAKDFKKAHKSSFPLVVKSEYFPNLMLITLEIDLPPYEFMQSFIITPTDNFYSELNRIAAKNNVVLSMNNTGSTFWIKKSI